MVGGGKDRVGEEKNPNKNSPLKSRSQGKITRPKKRPFWLLSLVQDAVSDEMYTEMFSVGYLLMTLGHI